MDASDLLRNSLLQLSKQEAVRDVIQKAPVSRSVVKRFVPGAAHADAVRAAAEMAATGRMATIDYLGEDTTDVARAKQTKDAYLQLLTALRDEGLTETGTAEVSLKLSALGQALPGDGNSIALEHAREICTLADLAGTTVTLDMEDHTTTDLTLEALRELRSDFPSVGAVLQSYLRRTEADCRDLATAGSRVRLCKGAYKEPESVAFQSGADVDKSYVRCLKILMQGEGYPMVATHDPRLVEIAGALAAQAGRAATSFEYQMLYGIRPDEQRRISDRGDRMRVYIPYGQEWYGYLMRRMAEKPANVMFFVRGLATRG
ncbi:proline dehydrogenase family protein [Intrasporangium calvum]|uniref:proline dehydrogenase n=1 Tax=Intrasporangium calvum (strain ATCC 23552 / DSM 43043 / JCM 3097 / NBRC 12989 / NCIMB 10167 / NRRL B-3866 / 7 KIP) TaxID=710696 RepID=E6S9Z6_INTC7|nr:proline dehydrogenase family protein [Intrasporangium calvum]ADU47186.1 L-proline dehydrogenase [Intrasporangium calvum DSM 43043]